MASREEPRLAASARICFDSSPCRPAMALASVSSRMSFTRSRTRSGSISCSRPAMNCASSPVGVSLKLGTRILDRLRPLHDLRLDERAEFVWRRDRRLRGEADEPLTHLLRAIDLRHRAVDLLQRCGRYGGGAYEAVPADRHI